MKTDVVPPEGILEETAVSAALSAGVSDPDEFQTAQVFTVAGGHFVHDTYCQVC